MCFGMWYTHTLTLLVCRHKPVLDQMIICRTVNRKFIDVIGVMSETTSKLETKFYMQRDVAYWFGLVGSNDNQAIANYLYANVTNRYRAHDWLVVVHNTGSMEIKGLWHENDFIDEIWDGNSGEQDYHDIPLQPSARLNCPNCDKDIYDSDVTILKGS
jgi:hypothetical protein